ncbi:glycosyltransferase family 59 protein [Mixia osmundae IAM 14324]|nr:glycosyltransferase family 59 protein [Mixia osmundae IAM 14324]KEI39856.1 glycosyltransferase family 59 protein [Mixia osmundae IAM 14324]
MPFLMYRIMRLLRIRRTWDKSRAKQRTEEPTEPLEAITLALFPPLYFFAFLYYTDMLSTALMLGAYERSLSRQQALAALLGLASVSLRQTNIVWVAYIAGCALVHDLERRDLESIPLESATLSRMPTILVDLVSTCLRRPATVAKLAGPFVPVFALFIAFVRYNGGIVLGDKANHVVMFHLPQLLYFSAFTAAFNAPLLIVPVLHFRPSRAALLLAPLACVSMLVVVRYLTYEHLFMLSDNRHYVFYVWQRIYQAHPLARYIMVLVYLPAAVLVHQISAAAQTWSALSYTIWLLATTLALVPTPLIEPRYYILPFLVYRLHLSRPQTATRRQWQLCLLFETASYVGINALTLYVFLYKPFKWPSESGLQRFMF